MPSSKPAHLHMRARSVKYILSLLLVLMTLNPTFAAEDTIGISGNHFTRNGVTWAAKGVTIVGRVAPRPLLKGDYAAAHDMFNASLLRSIRSFGADTIRFQVSEASLDPQSETYDANYKDEILSAVTMSRGLGFVVIISMQWHGPAGGKGDPGLPSARTQRAWSAIAPTYANMKNVIFEVFNEPRPKSDTAQNWTRWKLAMQDIVNTIRQSSGNILLLDGLRSAHFLTAVPDINDPLHKIGYAVHPYFEDYNRTLSQWQDNWGSFATTHPVMVTEFNAASNRSSQCFTELPARTKQLLAYLKGKQMGMTLWAFDLPNVQTNGVLTNFNNFKCGARPLYAAAEMVSNYYKSSK